MPAPRKTRPSEGSQTITLEQYKAALEAKDLDTLRRTGTDMAAHAPLAPGLLRHNAL